MILDNYGLPRDRGATDSMDSARLAGMMALVGHRDTPDLRRYVVNGLGVRHPEFYPANNPWNFTRDQLLPLASGLCTQLHIYAGSRDLYFAVKNRNWRCQNIEKDFPGSRKKFPDGADFLLPHHIYFLSICGGINPGIILSLVGQIFMFIDILFNAVFFSKRESNQLIAMILILGPFWVRLYKKLTPNWRLAIENYWSGWRGEKELAKMIIDKLELY